jgi:hypothetical protein
MNEELGKVINVIPDCSGRARYVDVYKITDYFNFTGGNRPVQRMPDGSFVFEEERQPDPAKAKRRVRYRTAQNVKIYDPSGVRSVWQNWEGFVGVWVDPKTRLVTHVFLSGAGGE